MKKMLLWFLGFVGFMFMGCSTVTETRFNPQISQEALEASGLQGAPSWIFSNGVGENTMVGSAVVRDGDIQRAIKEAIDVARTEFAAGYSIIVSGDARNDKDVKHVIQNVKITNSRMERWWVNNSSTKVFVLLRVYPDKKTVQY